MKLKYFSFVALISSVFVACNKDEDIIVDIPSDSSLPYTVVEYIPAPGQFINDPVTGFNDVKTYEDAAKKAESRLSQNLFVSLGAWGGSIIIKFNNPVKNTGGYDFSISSNAFDTSNEPGIVWVMEDKNSNGIPDEQWYELKGSYFGKEGYERNYSVTYKRPEAEQPTPWEDSNGETGFVYWMGNYHSQPFYYPEWVKDDSYTLYGSRLPSMAHQNEISGNWENDPFEWGYADNFGKDFLKDGSRNFFRISDAIDHNNEEVNIPEIVFVRVQTAINGSASILGENSTEVSGFFPLN